MSKPTGEELNEPLNLTNMNLQLWRPLIEIMNDNTPSYYSGDGFEFLQALQIGGKNLEEAIIKIDAIFNEA